MDAVVAFLTSDTGMGLIATAVTFVVGWLLPNKIPAATLRAILEGLKAVVKALVSLRKPAPPATFEEAFKDRTIDAGNPGTPKAELHKFLERRADRKFDGDLP